MGIADTMNLCPLCKRGSRGFGLAPDLIGLPGEPLWFCSQEHLRQWKTKAKKGLGWAMDWRPDEDKLILEAGKQVGQYLESINKFDLRTLTKEEWLEALRCYTLAYTEGRAEQFEGFDDDIPF